MPGPEVGPGMWPGVGPVCHDVTTKRECLTLNWMAPTPKTQRVCESEMSAAQ